MSSTTTQWMTAAEFEAFCKDAGRCELICGEVKPLSPAGYEHSRICNNVAFFLSQWARKSERGRVLVGEAGMVVETKPDTVRGADIAYFSYARVPRGTTFSGFSSTAPELVVEVVGKGQGWGEMVEKAGEYLAMGVDRVWVIDPDTRRVHVFRSDAEPARVSEGETLADEAVLPGFSCRVGEFFED